MPDVDEPAIGVDDVAVTGSERNVKKGLSMLDPKSIWQFEKYEGLPRTVQSRSPPMWSSSVSIQRPLGGMLNLVVLAVALNIEESYVGEDQSKLRTTAHCISSVAYAMRLPIVTELMPSEMNTLTL